MLTWSKSRLARLLRAKTAARGQPAPSKSGERLDAARQRLKQAIASPDEEPSSTAGAEG